MKESKIVFVTGASSGFGAEICHLLIQNGYLVIGAARRLEKLKDLQDRLEQKNLKDHFYPLELDVTNSEQIEHLFDNLPQTWQNIDILINNAGLALGIETADQAYFKNWQQMIDTNVVGLVHLTHHILPKMVAKNQGYIINMGSVAGTYPYRGGNVYGATKAFVRQFSLNLRTDLLGKKIRVTNIEPGLCGGTEFSLVRFNQDAKKAEQVYENVQSIQPKDIANTVFWLLQQPDYMNVNTIEIMPVAQVPGGLTVDKTMD